MLVREKKKAPAHKGQTEKVAAVPHIFPAPVRGLVLVGSQVTPPPASAILLDNFICTTDGIAPRGGCVKHATLGAAAVSLFTYRTGTTEKMFAATASDVFNVTSPADPDVAEPAVIAGLSSGYFSTVQFGNASGNTFMLAVNGTDYLQIYNGTSWSPVADETINTLSFDALTSDFTIGETLTGGTSGATAEILGIGLSAAAAGTLYLGAITGGPYQDNEAITSAGGAATADGASAASTVLAITGKATTAFSAVWSHARRVWFVEKNTSSAWYMATNSVYGTVTEFPLSGVFRRGGSLLFGTTWSMDAGDGMDDKCLFVSTEGEVAVYSGIDPASTSTWSLEGVFDMPRPLGRNAFIRAGGDVLIATEIGLIPVSSAIQRDVNAQTGISQAIAPLWQSQVRKVDTEQWEIIKVPSRGVMVVSQPDTADADGTALCVNMQTGAWSRFIGWDTRCLTEFNDLGYFGNGDGHVMLMDSGGNDNGASYSCRYIGQFEHLEAMGAEKTAVQAKAMFKAASPINPKVSILVDYNEDLPTAPASPANYTADVWDSGLWDVAVWDAGTSYSTYGNWQAVGATGTTMAPAVQMTFGVTPTPAAEFSSVAVMYTAGAQVA